MTIREALYATPVSQRFFIVCWVNGEEIVLDTAADLWKARIITEAYQRQCVLCPDPRVTSVDCYDRKFGGLVSEIEGEFAGIG